MQFNKDNLSPSAIAADMQEAIQNLPDFESWLDYFEGGAGRTILELVAGSQAIKNHYNLMRVREGSLSHAKMDSSITELAVNKGVYRPPAKGAIIEYNFYSQTSGNVQVGEYLGTYKDMEVYSLEGKYIYAGDNTLQVTMGHRIEKVINIVEEEDFHIEELFFDDIFIGDHFHRLTIGVEELILSDVQMNLYNPDITRSVISMVFSNQAKLVFGDNVIGYKPLRNEEVTYTCLTFDKTVVGDFDEKKLSFQNAEMFNLINSFSVLRQATGYLDKDTLRRIAIRASVDGRWVETKDYENGILREFGEYLSDVNAEDNYPQEDITILPKTGMGTDTVKASIEEMIENKRGNAVLVVTEYIDPEDPVNYVDIEMQFDYFGVDSVETIDQVIADFQEELQYKIFTDIYWLISTDLAIDMTRKLPSGKMYGSLTENFEIGKHQFIRNLTINYTIK